MHENEISKIVVDKAYKVHRTLGPGLFESVYEKILVFELMKHGLAVRNQQAIPLVWESIEMDQGFRADLIIENKLLVEIKATEMLHPVHRAQVITYLKLTGIRLGLLINFNVALIKEGIVRVVNGL